MPVSLGTVTHQVNNIYITNFHMPYFSFRCAPVPVNETCKEFVIGLESYAIDVAQLEQNIAIVNALEGARLAILGSDINPSCVTLVDWTICISKLPPCVDTKLILPCLNSCGVILSFFATCFNIVQSFVSDQIVREHFQHYRCHLPESYYDGFNEDHFTKSSCVGVPLG